jgi:hypothetical protein
LIGFNDLATTHPNLALEALGWDPSTIVAGSEKKQKWLCGKNHEFIVSLNSRTSMNTGCPYCAHQKILKGFNDLKTTMPELALEAYGWDPSEVIGSGLRKLKWKCSKNDLTVRKSHKVWLVVTTLEEYTLQLIQQQQSIINSVQPQSF